MSYYQTILDNVRRLKANDFAGFKAIINEAIAENDERGIVDLIDQQLTDGVRSDGQRTLRYVTGSSYLQNVKMSRPTALPHRDYKNTGEYRNSIRARAEGGKVLFFALDPKTVYIEGEEDNQLLGLTEENKVVAFNNNINVIQNAISRAITRGASS